jgi:methylated-DNA-protein-cysteine methyltransferase-like protein
LDGETALERKPAKVAATKGDEKVSAERRARIVSLIRSLPSGSVSTYGAIAREAGWPGAARQVVRVLRQVPGLPWQRVLGSGGVIKLPGENGAEQKIRLRMEGVTFRGARVDMKRHEFKFSRGSAEKEPEKEREKKPEKKRGKKRA